MMLKLFVFILFLSPFSLSASTPVEMACDSAFAELLYTAYANSSLYETPVFSKLDDELIVKNHTEFRKDFLSNSNKEPSQDFQNKLQAFHSFATPFFKKNVSRAYELCSSVVKSTIDSCGLLSNAECMNKLKNTATYQALELAFQREVYQILRKKNTTSEKSDKPLNEFVGQKGHNLVTYILYIFISLLTCSIIVMGLLRCMEKFRSVKSCSQCSSGHPREKILTSELPAKEVICEECGKKSTRPID